jgi:hypothetical protein
VALRLPGRASGSLPRDRQFPGDPVAHQDRQQRRVPRTPSPKLTVAPRNRSYTGTPILPSVGDLPVPYIAKRVAQLDRISWSGIGCAGSLKRTGCFPPSTQKFQRLGVRTPHWRPGPRFAIPFARPDCIKRCMDAGRTRRIRVPQQRTAAR